MTKSTLITGLVSLALIFTAAPALAGDVFVGGHFRSDGLYYVQPHYRSSPDASYNNNWGVKPNVNPYTGQQGLLNPTWNNQPPNPSFFGQRPPIQIQRPYNPFIQ